MKPRAVIFDIYSTLLELGPPPEDADARWRRLFEDLLGTPPGLSRLEFSIATSRIIAREHAAARARGIAWPEVQWPAVVAEVLPQFARLSPPQREEFVFRQVQTGHTTELAAATAAMLRQVREQIGLLGIASNAQAYTMRELQEGLATHGLGLDLFAPELCFWSFTHGFSKPDPHVFQLLTARLAARGIAAADLLMIGDRLDHDLQPARAHGWQAWQRLPTTGDDWAGLLAQLPGPTATGSPP